MALATLIKTSRAIVSSRDLHLLPDAATQCPSPTTAKSSSRCSAGPTSGARASTTRTRSSSPTSPANNATLQPEVRTHPVGAKGTLFMVADGMGGAAAGEIASEMAIEIVLGSCARTGSPSKATDRRGVRARAQARDEDRERADPRLRDVASGVPRHGHHRDDRRAARRHALPRAGRRQPRATSCATASRKQITKDQSLMQKLIEAGELTEEEAEQSERRNIILQALGPEPTIKVDLTLPAGAPRRHARAVQRRAVRPGVQGRDRADRHRGEGPRRRRASGSSIARTRRAVRTTSP